MTLIQVFGICDCAFILVFLVFMIHKVSKYYDSQIEANEKKYIDHIDDWYYEILEDEE